MSDQTNTLLFQVEQEIAKLLLFKLEKFNITFERASQIAKFILKHLPENMTDEQVMKIIPSLDDRFFELSEIVHKHMLDYEEKHKDEAIKNMQDMIKHKHFQEASNLAFKYFEQKVELK
jgi:hypothetical protein